MDSRKGIFRKIQRVILDEHPRPREVPGAKRLIDGVQRSL
jgi:hypothetical protein